MKGGVRMSDKSIIDKFFDRNDEAISETQARYGKILKHVAENLLGNSEDAEECLNDTLLTAWNTIPPNKPEHLSAYLVTVIRRKAFGVLDKRTAAKRGERAEISEEFFELIPSCSDTESEFERRRINSIINDFLRTRKEDERRLFILRYYCSESLKSAAESVGVSESAAKTKLWRLRCALRTVLEKEDISL